jgi:hypothetical protein
VRRSKIWADGEIHDPGDQPKKLTKDRRKVLDSANRLRAERIVKYLGTYSNSDVNDPATDLVDILTDYLHLQHLNPDLAEIEAIISQARLHFNRESTQPDFFALDNAWELFATDPRMTPKKIG